MKKQISILFLLIVTLMLVFTSCGIANKKVESIQILSGAPAEVEVGKTPDFSDIKVKVTYNDGQIKEVGYSDVTISTVDTSKVGKVEYTVSYDGASAKASINVKAAGTTITEVQLDSISYLSGIQTEFYEGADFHLTNLKVTAHYSDGSTKTVTYDKLTVKQNIDADTVGEQTLIVSYEGKECRIKITVLKIEAVRLSLVLNGFVNKALIGKSFDTSLITGTVHYNNSSTQNIANADITFSAVDTSSAGQKTLVGTYNGMSAECNVDVLGIKSIEFSGFKTAIKFNEELDLTALTANVIASDNSEYTLAAADITVDKAQFNTTLDGVSQKTTKIFFSYCGSVRNYNITVTAERADATLLSLEYVSGIKTKLFVGEEFNDSSLVATANRTFGFNSVGTLTKADLTVEGTVNTAVAGTYPVTYSLTEGSITKSFTVNVVVTEPNPSDLVLSTNDLGWVIKGETVDVSGITATLYYEYGTKTTSIANSELTISGVATDTAGKVEITVSHEASGLTEIATVNVVEIQSVVFNGVNDRYRVNTQIASSNITISILGTDGKTYVRSVDSNAVIPTLTLDITKTSESKEYVFTYYGVEFKKNIEVYAEFADATLLSVTYTGSERVFRGDSFIDKVSVLAKYTYGFERTYRVSDGVTFEGDVNTALTGNYDFTVSYGGKTANGTVSVVFPKVTGIVINSAPIAIKGENYDFESIHVTVTLENNTTLDATLKDLTDYNITSDLNVAVAGDNTLTLTANGKNYTKTVKVYEIEKIVINTDGFKTTVQLGTTFSTEGLGEIYVYLVGGQAPVIREVSEFNHNVNMNVTGKNYTLTTTYLGVTSEPVKITVADQNFIISGAANPPAIEAWISGTYKDKFLDSGYYYVVGDDNPFKYAIEFQLFDIINNQPGSVGSLEYVGNSIVTLDGVPVGTEYVVIDEVNHTFDFTEAAIGKNFVITTAHKDYSEYTKSLEVSIVDAYNIDEAIELNLLTNFNDIIGNSGKQQMTVLYTFLANNMVAGINDMSYEEYVAFVNGINGIVIHGNMVIAREDLPDEYFFTTASGEKYLWDHQSVYYRVFTEYKFDDPDENEVTPEVFNLYGNYFTVVSNNIPIVAPNGTKDSVGTTTNNDDELSSSQLFAFDIADDVQKYAEENDVFFAENYVLNIYAFGIHDNDPSVAVQPELAAKRSKLGIIGMKFRRGTYNVNSVNAEAYFISMFPDYDDVVVNFDYCTFYNAWNNHIMTWSMNDIDRDGDQYDGSIHKGYTPLTVNVTNSFIGKCGGPVIMANSKNPDKEFNTATSQKQNINIDDKTNIFSYVKGDESWFVAFNATPIVGQISDMNAFFAAQGASYKTLINGNEFMNMIIVNMDSDFNPADPSSATKDVDGSFTIGENVIVDMNDWSDGENNYNYGHGGEIDKNRNNGGNMVFATSSGGVAHFDMSNYSFSADAGNPTEGDYITLYAFNLGIGLGFNEPALDAEPTPADCTVERITELHGIN